MWQKTPMEAKDLHALRARPEYLGQPLHCGAHGGAPGTDSNDTQQHILPPDNFQTPLTTTAQTDQFYFFLKKKKKKEKEPTKQQKQGSHLAPKGTGHASQWAGPSTHLSPPHLTAV